MHQFRPLSAEEVTFILTRQWEQLGLRLSPEDFTDQEALAAVIRITGGNFRLLHRLLTQVERILVINELRTVTKEVVEAAREGLVIGPRCEEALPKRSPFDSETCPSQNLEAGAHAHEL